MQIITPAILHHIFNIRITPFGISQSARSNLKKLSTFDNIICLPGQPRGVLASVLSLAERMMLMSTYEEFMVILTIGLLIVAILNLKNK